MHYRNPNGDLAPPEPDIVSENRFADGFRSVGSIARGLMHKLTDATLKIGGITAERHAEIIEDLDNRQVRR